ncbi:hypothetical protein EON65_16795 [archaeon]|nr:MAG: hypothetical protein EON65_16795 [archaeon]
MSVVLDGPITSSNIHRKLCKLAQVVQLDNFLTENSQEDDYMMVLEEAISKIQRLSSSASEQAQQLEQMKTAKKSKKDHVILEKSKKVEDELLNTLQQVEGRNEWYEKYKRLGNKLKKERAQNSVLEEFVQGQNKKIAVLVDHTEKLMKALKLENTKRMKTLDETRKIQKEELTLREKIDKQARVNQAQQRYVCRHRLYLFGGIWVPFIKLFAFYAVMLLVYTFQ